MRPDKIHFDDYVIISSAFEHKYPKCTICGRESTNKFMIPFYSDYILVNLCKKCIDKYGYPERLIKIDKEKAIKFYSGVIIPIRR